MEYVVGLGRRWRWMGIVKVLGVGKWVEGGGVMLRIRLWWGMGKCVRLRGWIKGLD